MLGFGACRASYLLCFVALSSYSSNTPGILDIYWLAAVLSAVTVAFAAFRTNEHQILYDRVWTCAGIFSVGGLLIMLCASRFDMPVLLSVGAACAGIGCILLYVLWGVKLSRLSSREIVFYVVIDLVIAACIVFVVNLFGDIATYAALVLALVTLFMLENPLVNPKSRTDSGNAVESGSSRAHPTTAPMKELVRLCMMTVILTFGYHVAAMTFTSTTIWNRDIEGIAISGLSLLIVSLTSRVRLMTIFRFIVPVIVASYLFLELLPPEFADLCVIVGGSGFRLSWIFIWIVLIDMAHTNYDHRWFIVGAGVSAMFAGRILASLVAFVFAAFQLNDSTLVIYLLVITLVIAVLLILPGTSDRDEKAGEEATSMDDSPDRMKDRCLRVSDEYGLTKRETEVLRLLVAGRSQGIIAKRLGISEGTVHVHITHIYQKLDVHGQQEVISLVEDDPTRLYAWE